MGGANCVGGQKKELVEYLLDNFRAFGIDTDHWTTTAQDERES